MSLQKQELIDYCKRKLGAPVLEINVADEQIEDLVDDAVQFFQERHFDGVYPTFYKYKLTQNDIDRGRAGHSGGIENGVECDNDGTGSSAQPVTHPKLFNMILVGPNTSSALSNHNLGLRFRRATQFTMKNIELKTKIINDKYTEYVYEAFDIQNREETSVSASHHFCVSKL